MDIVIHPTYFASIAHYVVIAKAGSVVFEVTDNYQKQTYRSRAYIYGANGRLPLVVPVKYTQKNRQLYSDVKIANEENWQELHWKSLQSAYRTSPFFEFYEDELFPIFNTKHDYILDLNFKCLEAIFKCLQWDCQYSKTSEFVKTVTGKTDFRHLVNARKESTFNFNQYTQVFSNKHGFLGNLSILDLLFNEGPNTMNYLESQALNT